MVGSCRAGSRSRRSLLGRTPPVGAGHDWVARGLLGRAMFKRRRIAVLGVLAAVAASIFVLPASSASAASATVPNACANSVTPNFSQIGVTTSGDDGVTTVAPGGAITLTGLSQSAAIPGAIFVAGYNLGLLQVGVNNVPANVQTTIEATNTVQGTQTTNQVGGSPPDGTVFVTTTITDPDGTPGTGDETATDASFSVTYDNLNWTAGAISGPDYRQESIAAAPPTTANQTLLINALVGGVFPVQFRCAPGTVTPPDPGTITLIDPAPSFDTTLILQIFDPTGVVIVNGPVTSTKTSKNFVFKVTNVGIVPTTINPGDVTSSVDVNSAPTGSVSVAGLPITLGPGASKRLKLAWSYDSLLATGDSVVFHACVNVVGDINPANDCDDATVTAK
jgi:hypothetical protein